MGLVSNDWSTFDGWAVSRGFDPLTLPFDRFLSVVYHWATRGGEPEEVEKFNTRLYRPPKGEVATHGPWTAEAETAAFAAFKAQVSN